MTTEQEEALAKLRTTLLRMGAELTISGGNSQYSVDTEKLFRKYDSVDFLFNRSDQTISVVFHLRE